MVTSTVFNNAILTAWFHKDRPTFFSTYCAVMIDCAWETIKPAPHFCKEKGSIPTHISFFPMRKITLPPFYTTGVVVITRLWCKKGGVRTTNRPWRCIFTGGFPRPCLVQKNLQNMNSNTFICIWQILSNYKLTRLKRFVLSIPTKLCN